MRAETTYYAFDETDFDNESECLEYERRAKELSESVIFLDENFELLDPIEDWETLADKVWYVIIKDAENARAFIADFASNLNYSGFENLAYSSNDILTFSLKEDDWVNLKVEYENVKKEFERVNSIAERFLKENQ